MPRFISPYRIFAPLFFEGFDFSEFEVVISSTNIYFAKGIIARPETTHFCYCHTPPRYLYGYQTLDPWQKVWWKLVSGSVANHFLRIYDYLAAQRVDYFIANSKNTAQRIEKFYRRKTEVIYPPVNIKEIRSSPVKIPSRGYFLFVSRLCGPKHPELAVEACNQLRLALKVVGTGPGKEAIKKLAGPTVEVLGEVKDKKLWELYRGCKALIWPAEDEDFGIVPVEAMAAGRPVLALRSGGVTESVIEGKTGEFFERLTVDCLSQVLKRFDESRYKNQDCRKHAEKFSKERFKKEIQSFVMSKIPRKKPKN
jgi:glycosyltransferase involved in cell wall biosynthesis